jgi:hypothetical protein
LRFLTTLRMSLGIQKYTDFDRFFCGMEFERLFSWKYKYFDHLTIPLKPSRLFFFRLFSSVDKIGVLVLSFIASYFSINFNIFFLKLFIIFSSWNCSYINTIDMIGVVIQFQFEIVHSSYICICQETSELQIYMPIWKFLNISLQPKLYI